MQSATASQKIFLRSSFYVSPPVQTIKLDITSKFSHFHDFLNILPCYFMGIAVELQINIFA